MTKIFLTFCLLALTAPAEAKNGLLQRIDAACRERLAEDFSNAKGICGCLTKKLSKMKEHELEILARSYEEDPSVEEELQKEEHSQMLRENYDFSVACLKLGEDLSE